MRRNWFLHLLLAAGVLLVLGGCEHFFDMIRTPEGQAAAGTMVNGAANLATNPLNPFAWWDVLRGASELVMGTLAIERAVAAKRHKNAAIEIASDAPTTGKLATKLEELAALRDLAATKRLAVTAGLTAIDVAGVD